MVTDIENRVIEIVADELGLSKDKLLPESKLADLFGDSLEYMSFIVRLREVGEVPDEAIAVAETLGDLIDVLDAAN